jgi:hypothetical protein
MQLEIKNSIFLFISVMDLIIYKLFYAKLNWLGLRDVLISWNVHI